MELLNATKMIAGYTMGMKPDGRELVVVVVKGTFDIPSSPHEAPKLSEEQIPLVMADEFTGEPGFSATTVEADFVPVKPNAEVILNGSAYAPRGVPTTSIEVGLRVGSLSKSFRVVGNRVWGESLVGPLPTEAEPFVKMPITYDLAFGGVDETEEPHTAYRPNPVGRGYHHRPTKSTIVDRPLPNTEELGRPIRDPRGSYRPMSFGPIGRACPPRVSYAGTYDEQWLENQFPFLPEDFDERYYQSAPQDQQLKRLKGGELVELLNLTPKGRCQFRLPNIPMPVEFILRDFDSVKQDATLDTLFIEPDKNRFCLLWRTSLPLKQNMFEINMAVIGKMPRAWYRARESAKDYYPNLNDLIAAKSE